MPTEQHSGVRTLAVLLRLSVPRVFSTCPDHREKAYHPGHCGKWRIYMQLESWHARIVTKRSIESFLVDQNHGSKAVRNARITINHSATGFGTSRRSPKLPRLL